jgi:peptide/nickel transport system permease protein
VLAYALRRIAGAIPLLLGVATLVFLILSLAPGDPALIALRPGTPQAVIDQIRDQWGLNDPLLVRYGKWLFAFLQGDFGYSQVQHMWVKDRILLALPNTLLLTGLSLVLTFLSGIAIGVVQAMRKGTVLDTALSAVTLFFYSMPAFWLALMLIWVFSSGPEGVGGAGAADVAADLMTGWDRFLDRLERLVLPVLTLTLVLAAGVARYVRTSMLEALSQDFIRTARAKGLPESRVILSHGLRAALIPVVTLLGVYLPLLMSGAVLIEMVFGYPGLGWLMWTSIGARDYPMVLAVSFLFGVMVVVGNLLADLLYAAVDPRMRKNVG